MKSELNKLKELSCLESHCKNQTTINTIMEALEGNRSIYGSYNSGEEAISAIMSALDEEEANENN